MLYHVNTTIKAWGGSGRKTRDTMYTACLSRHFVISSSEAQRPSPLSQPTSMTTSVLCPGLVSSKRLPVIFHRMRATLGTSPAKGPLNTCLGTDLQT